MTTGSTPTDLLNAFCEAWHSYREWIETVNPRMSFEVAARFALGREVTAEQRATAQRVRERVMSHLRELTRDGAVLCLPTAPFPAPERGLALSTRRALHHRLDTILSSAGLAGTPEITLPVAEVGGLPIGLSFIGGKGSDEVLIALASELPVGEDPPP